MSHPRRDGQMRPQKAERLFTWTESKMFTAREIFNGRLGNEPLLLAISSGFYPTHRGPGLNHMQQFETGEVLFAFQRAFQRRVLLYDSRDRTLSLPLLSPLLFRVKDSGGRDKEKAMTVEEVVKTMTLPVRLSFHQKEDLVFVVDRDFMNHQFFGDLTLVSVYLEPFLCCLPVGNEDGKTLSKVVALPCRMRRLGLSLVDGIKGQSDLWNTFKGYCRAYEEAAKTVSPLNDTFFKELAFVSRKAKIAHEADIPDYIDENTFIDILCKRPLHRQEGAKTPAEQQENTDALYESLVPVDRDSHVYSTSYPDGWDAKNKLSTPTAPAANDTTAKSQLVRAVSGSDIQTLLAEPQTGLPPPLPNRPQVTSLPREGTQASSGKPSALPPSLPPRRPVRTTSTEYPRDVTPGSERSLAASSPNLSQVDQTTFRSTRPFQGPPNRFNIEKLTVADVCSRLQALGLGKHCKEFKKQRIDGKLLNRLSRRAFEEEFHLSEIEIVKLSTFIEEGHIPR